MSQSTRKRLIQWSPHNKSSFIVGSNDLRLYNFKFKDKNEKKNENNINNSNQYNQQQQHNIYSPKSITSKYLEAYNFDIEYPPDDWVPQEKKTISLISVNSDVQLMKCMAWCPGQSDTNLIACGLTSGRAILTSFSSVNRVLKELVPKHTRSCNAISWNPIYTNQLAVGLDKVRGDSSTLIWDINYLQSASLNNHLHKNNNYISKLQQQQLNNIDQPYIISQISDNSFSTSTDYTDTIYQPISEFTQSEATLALAWLPNNPSCLLVGTGSKWLKLYDIRDVNSSQSVMAHQKSVNGVCIDPFDFNRIATMSEDSHIKVWDLRNLDDPLIIVNSNCKSIQQIDWCPTRSGVLASLGKDKSSIKLWDIKAPIEFSKSPKLESTSLISNSGGSNSSNHLNKRSTSNNNQDPINTISKPTKIHHSPDVVSSFSWHPTNECRMLTVSYSGVIDVVSLNENIPISWSPHGGICFSFGNNVLEGPIKGETLEPNILNYKNLINDGRYEKDISSKIKERAIFGYSANVEVNINLANKINDENINFLWKWIQKVPIQIQNFKRESSLITTILSPPSVSITTPSGTSSTTKTINNNNNNKNNNNNNNNINNNNNNNKNNNNNNNNNNNIIINNNNNNIINNNNEYNGIYNILIEKDISTVESSNGFVLYKSPNRNLCLSICGWGFNQSLPLENILSRLEKSGEYERAAAIAVFHLDIKRAILVVTNATYNIHPVTQTNHHGHLMRQDREFSLKLLSIALAGFDGTSTSAYSNNNNSIWKETCKSTAKSFINPYLKTCLEFLASNSDSKDIYSIIEDSRINLDDKIAFSCKYLDYQDLIHFVERNTIRVIECGNLKGVLLTGLTGRGVDLLSNYIDRTCDIQTAVLAISLVVPKFFRDKRVSKWSSIYSDLLDQWKLWHERAILDIQTRISGIDQPPSPQIFAKCGFCQNSFAFESISASSIVGRNASKPNFKAKVPFCPHCKQSLPRCCLCLLPLNCMVPTPEFKKSNTTIGSGGSITSSGGINNSGTINNPNDSQLWSNGSEPFEDWFTWCQTCRHGGHSQHILDWFRDHSICPVTSCDCRCSQL
ncbi:hypothetical protein ACTFIZ_010242 [Dictyostelium cf. discoideum]